MYNKLIKTTMLGIAGILFMISGCKEDFLDTKNPNQLTEEQFWKTEADVLAAVASVYSPMRQPLYGYWGAFTGIQNINSLGDDVLAFPGGEAATMNIAMFTNDATNSDAGSTFQNLYKSIYRANQVLGNIDKVTMEEGKKNQFIAETKFLRGLCFFTLASNYGDVPLIIASAKTAEDQFVPSSPVAKVYEQAIQDFTDASNGLPADRSSGDLGRATSGAALAYLGKAYLYIKDYRNAQTTLEKLYTTPYNYDLVDKYSDNFTSENEFNKEAVFQLVYGAFGDPYGPWAAESANSGMYNYLPQLIGPREGGGWFKYAPTNYFVKEFMKEERPAGSDTRFDKRMYYTLFWKRSLFGEPDVTWYGGTKFDAIWASARANVLKVSPASLFDTINPGKFLISKFTNAWTNTPSADNYWSATPSTANNVIMRFAEVLLMRAEAAAQNQEFAKAISDLNRIRKRAGLVEKTAANLPDLKSIMAELSHQKMLEMFFEQNRWHDLKRWYTPEELKAYFIAVNKQGAQYMQPKNYIFPIPTSELQTNNKITQNPLWKAD